MSTIKNYVDELKTQLKKLSTAEKAKSSERYFPRGVNCLGVNAADIKVVIKAFHEKKLEPNTILQISEYLLKKSKYNEEVLLAFGLLNKVAKKFFDDSLLDRFEYWLETYVEN